MMQLGNIFSMLPLDGDREYKDVVYGDLCLVSVSCSVIDVRLSNNDIYIEDGANCFAGSLTGFKNAQVEYLSPVVNEPSLKGRLLPCHQHL